MRNNALCNSDIGVDGARADGWKNIDRSLLSLRAPRYRIHNTRARY